MCKVGKDDAVCAAAVCSAADQVLLASSDARILRMNATDVPLKGRASGVKKGLKPKPGQRLVDLVVLPSPLLTPAADTKAEDGASDSAAAVKAGGGPWLLLVTANGKGGLLAAGQVAQQGRGTMGVTQLKLGPGDRLVAARLAGPGDEVVLGRAQGGVQRLKVADVKVLGANGKGTQLIEMTEQDSVTSVGVIYSAASEGAAAEDA